MSAQHVTASLKKMSISGKSKTRKAAPADSWEDEADRDSDTETDGVGITTSPERPSPSNIQIAPPPPTPVSPSAGRERGLHHPAFSPLSFPVAFEGANTPDQTRPRTGTEGGEDKRPEKTTAVAARLIAAGLGQRAPKRTQEQREYDQAMRIQEKKKRDQAREEEERKKREKEAAQKAIWHD